LPCKFIEENWDMVRRVWKEKNPFLPANEIINNGRKQETSILCVDFNPQGLSPYLPLPKLTINFIQAECSCIKKQNSS